MTAGRQGARLGLAVPSRTRPAATDVPTGGRRRSAPQRDRVRQRPHPQSRLHPRIICNEQVPLKRVYLAVMALDPTGKGRARRTQRWKRSLNALPIRFDGRLSAARS